MGMTEKDVEKYQKKYDKNIAYKLLKKLRKMSKDKPKILSSSVGTIVNILGCFLSALENPALPNESKVKIMGTIGYIILPIDLIPDNIPVFGYSDDVAVAKFLFDKVYQYSTFDLDELDKEIDEENTGSVSDTELIADEQQYKDVQINRETVQNNGSMTKEEIAANIEKGNELFQKFLDKNGTLDDEFNKNISDISKQTDSMESALSKL